MDEDNFANAMASVTRRHPKLPSRASCMRAAFGKVTGFGLGPVVRKLGSVAPVPRAGPPWSEARAECIPKTAVEAEPLKNYVAGRWVEAERSGQLPVQNPSNGAILGQVPLSTRAATVQAIDAAAAAFPGWSRSAASRQVSRSIDCWNGCGRRRSRWRVDHRGERQVPARRPGGDQAADRELRSRLRDAGSSARRQAHRGVGRHRRRSVARAARRVRDGRALQLPGHGALLVSAVRDRHREHVRPETVGADAAHDDGSPRSCTTLACRPACSTWCMEIGPSSRRSSTIRASKAFRS